MQAYLEVAKHYVHDSLFSSYIHKVQPDCNHLWVFKKQLCISLALSGEALPDHRFPLDPPAQLLHTGLLNSQWRLALSLKHQIFVWL